MNDLGGDSLPVSSCPLIFKTIGGVYGPRHFLPLCSMIKSPGSCRSAPVSFKAAALCPGRDPLPAVRTSFVYRHALPRKPSKGPFGPSAEFIPRPAASGFRRAAKNARPLQSRVPRLSLNHSFPSPSCGWLRISGYFRSNALSASPCRWHTQ